jgi:hypothetical protein
VGVYPVTVERDGDVLGQDVIILDHKCVARRKGRHVHASIR